MILCLQKSSTQEANELEDSLGYIVTLWGLGKEWREMKGGKKRLEKLSALFSVPPLMKSYVTVFLRTKKPTSLFLLTRFQSSDFISFLEYILFLFESELSF